MGQDTSNSSKFEGLVDEYLEQVRNGNALEPGLYAKRHAEYETELRSLLPLMLAIENVAQEDSS